jgi:hypothetical protein
MKKRIKFDTPEAPEKKMSIHKKIFERIKNGQKSQGQHLRKSNQGVVQHHRAVWRSHSTTWFDFIRAMVGANIGIVWEGSFDGSV